MPLSLTFAVFNPHDPFTNLTVKWFRSDDVTTHTSTRKELINSSDQYQHIRRNVTEAEDMDNNCCNSSIYGDDFTLAVLNFTSDMNGYYWCQIVVNNTVAQPSQYVRIYAADDSSCTQPVRIFLQTSEPECAMFHDETSPTAVIYTSYPPDTYEISPTLSNMLPRTSAAFSVSTTSTVTNHASTLLTQPETGGMDQTAYVAGSLGAFVVLLASVVIVLLLLFVCKGQKKKCQQLKGELSSCCYNSNKIICNTADKFGSENEKSNVAR